MKSTKHSDYDAKNDVRNKICSTVLQYPTLVVEIHYVFSSFLLNTLHYLYNTPEHRYNALLALYMYLAQGK